MGHYDDSYYDATQDRLEDEHRRLRDLLDQYPAGVFTIAELKILMPQRSRLGHRATQQDIDSFTKLIKAVDARMKT